MGLHLTGSSLTQLNNAFVGRWRPSTAYLSGQVVIAPDGSVEQATSNFTSGASFDQSNWTALVPPTTQAAAGLAIIFGG